MLILDSHNTIGKWANHYRIVGHGRDYSAIETELKNLVEMMDGRYKELANGKIKERGHDLITVISDEFTTIAENIKNLDSVLLPLLTESRKVGIDFIVACHSETASSLGLKGRFDLKKNFDAVLRLKNISGKRLIDLDNGESIINYHHVGQFINNAAVNYQTHFVSNDFNAKLELILNNPVIKDDLILEQQIIDKYYQLINSNSFSLSKLAKEIHGNSNGRYIAQIKQVLSSRGITTT